MRQPTHRRSCATPSAALTLALALGALCAAAPPAHAQQRLFLSDTPDIHFFGAVTPSVDGDVDRGAFRLRLEAGAAGLIALDSGEAPDAGFEASGRAMLGLALDDGAWLRLDAALIAPLGGSSGEEGLARVTGRHRIGARAVLGEVDEGSNSLEVTASLSLDHGLDPARFAAKVDVAPAAFFDRSAAVGIGWLKGIDSSGAWAWPITLSARQVGHPERPDLGATTESLSTGVGLTFVEDEHLDGWLELIGVSWGRTEFKGLHPLCKDDPTPCLRAAVGDKKPAMGSGFAVGPAIIDQLDLRLLHVDELVINIDDELLLGLVFSLGGSWLWDEAAAREVAMATFSAGFNAGIQDDEQHVAFGLVVLRAPAHSPDGAVLLTDSRVELNARYADTDLDISVEHRAFLGWLEDAELAAADRPEPVARYGLHSEWAYGLDPIEIGAWHQATRASTIGQEDLNPLTMDRAWRHELGLFVRLVHD